jgi:hypothetical protein
MRIGLSATDQQHRQGRENKSANHLNAPAHHAQPTGMVSRETACGPCDKSSFHRRSPRCPGAATPPVGRLVGYVCGVFSPVGGKSASSVVGKRHNVARKASARSQTENLCGRHRSAARRGPLKTRGPTGIRARAAGAGTRPSCEAPRGSRRRRLFRCLGQPGDNDRNTMASRLRKSLSLPWSGRRESDSSQ